MRAIDADALKREIVDFKVKLYPENRDYGTGYFSALSVVEGMLACAPTLTLDDLRPRGRWIPSHSEGYNPEYDLWFEWECSECRNYFANDEDEISYNFCPSCGADMRGGGEDG